MAINLTCVAADSVDEILDVRLAKAQLAYLHGNIELANRYLRKNLTNKKFHLNTYLFLGSTYRKIGFPTKALKVYYQAVGRSHGNRLLQDGNLKEVENSFNTYTIPDNDALAIYFLIATTYFDMFKAQPDKNYQSKLGNLAVKYFTICSHYDYKTTESKYHVGLINQTHGLHNKSIADFLESLESNTADPKKDGTVELMFSGSLATKGQYDAATIYLRKVYLSAYDSAIKRYAENYLDELGNTFSAFVVGTDLGTDNNVEKRTNTQLTNDPTINTSLYNTFSADALFSQGFAKYWKIKLQGNYENISYWESRLHSSDRREVGGTVTLQYDNILKSLAKLSYSESMEYYMDFTRDRYSKLYKRRELVPSYYHTLKSGTISYQLIGGQRTHYIDRTATTTDEMGVGLSYVPFENSKYFSPSYSVIYKQIEELGDTPTTNMTHLSFSNHFQFLSKFSTFFFWDYQIYSNPVAEFNYHLSKMSAIITYATPVQGLSLQGKIYYETTNYDGWILSSTDNKISQWKESIGLSYTL